MATTRDKIFIDNMEQVQQQKLGIVRGYAIAENLRKKIPSINIVEVDSISDGLKRVEKGELYGYIDNLMVIANAIQTDFTGVLKVSSRLDEGLKLAIGTRNDEPLLNQVFELLVKNISDGERQEIFNRWVAVQKEVGIDYQLFWKFLVIVVFISSAYFYHYVKLKRLNVRLLKFSTTDKLTGWYNRLKMDEVLANQQAAVERYGVDNSIILIDIDFFKQVNDTHGHLAGDAVLKQFAGILGQNIRSTDYVGRWGGEEFLIICPNNSMQDAGELAEKLLQLIRENEFPGIGRLTASAGVSQFSKQTRVQQLLSKVDSALYQSKQQGRNLVSFVK